MDIWMLYKVENLRHLLHYSGARRHHYIIGIYLCVALMEVSRSYAGYIAILRRDMQKLGMDFKALHTVYYIYALVLHTAAPLDVALLVETGQELHDGGDLLAVAAAPMRAFTTRESLARR